MNIKRATEHHEVMSILGKPKPAPRKKKQANPSIDKESILRSRKSLLCDSGSGKPGHDLHHCFIGRRKGFPVLDDERNLVLVNHDDHIAGRFDNLEWRRKFWDVQCKRYGKADMYEWVLSLPEKMLNRVDWL